MKHPNPEFSRKTPPMRYVLLMRYWELIADGLQRDGWSLGWFSFTSTGGDLPMWSADATKADGRRIVVQAEDLTVAFLELETQCRQEKSHTAEETRNHRR